MKADPIVSAYAEALFRLASAEEMADRVEEELHELERLYQGNAEMKDVLGGHVQRVESGIETEIDADRLAAGAVVLDALTQRLTETARAGAPTAPPRRAPRRGTCAS